MINRRVEQIARKLETSHIRTAWQKRQLLKERSFETRDRELLRRVDSRISSADGMYTGNGGHYFNVGLSAIQCIDQALDQAGLESVRKILDMPCGFGRVTRFLARRFPGAHITGCEILRDAVRFCEKTFGASPAYSSTDLGQLSLPADFDLIWCGSLITHLDADRTLDLLRFFDRHLTPGGLVVFTAHGEYVRQRMLRRESQYGLSELDLGLLIANHDRDGYAYADYPSEKGYGISLSSPEWIRTAVQRVSGMRDVYFSAQGWDHHQDVFGFVKPSQAMN
jgi:SAM-dependent methyltransferase